MSDIILSHRIFGISVLGSSILNLLIPVVVVEAGFEVTCAVRMLQGLSEGLLFPSSYAVMRHWAIPEERSRMGAVVLTGAPKHCR